MVDWEMPDGSTVRIEVEPVYCANCGKKYGFVPRDNTAFTFWLCRKCFDTYGEVANTYAMPDEDFNNAVAAEMEARFGHHLSDKEITDLTQGNNLGKMLEALERDSPYPSKNNRPTR
jgi:ribosomal protein L37AE/L43A